MLILLWGFGCREGSGGHLSNFYALFLTVLCAFSVNKTSKAVELLGSSTPVGKVADPGKPNLLAKPANVKKDTPVAKPLNVRNVPPAAKPLNDIQVAHNTTPADKHVSAGSTVAAVVIKSTENVDVSTSSELGACSTMTAGSVLLNM